jgi:hypothetical protein
VIDLQGPTKLATLKIQGLRSATEDRRQADAGSGRDNTGAQRGGREPRPRAELRTQPEPLSK